MSKLLTYLYELLTSADLMPTIVDVHTSCQDEQRIRKQTELYLSRLDALSYPQSWSSHSSSPLPDVWSVSVISRVRVSLTQIL